MDFRVVSLDSLVRHENGASSQVTEPETKTKVVGSGLAKEGRPGPAEENWRRLKMAKTDEISAPKTMSFHQGGASLLRSNSLASGCGGRPQEHMLNFSALKSEIPYYQHTPSAYTRNAAYGYGSLNSNMHAPITGFRGPFTPSQWIELEHQALIYKYINANVPVPSNLIIPLKKSLFPFGLSGSSAGSLPPNSFGWGSFHLGFSGNTDPEPGRCRRTDGKKWRCSRDAVADQKYCERHINRGRHRSRKPVEAQSGHAASGTTNSKAALPMTSSMSSASVISSGGASNSLTMAQNQFKSLQPGAANNRMHPKGLSIMSSTINLKSRESTFAIPKQDISFEEQSEFGLVSSDSLLNPSQKGSYINSKDYDSFMDFNDQESQDQHLLRHFIDEWPKDQSNRSTIAWPEELKSDWTQLSMSIPMASSEFSSSSSSPRRENLALSPLRLSREFDLSEPSQKHTNWIPISWGTSLGGPLGEALTNTGNSAGTCKTSLAALNLLTEGWDGSPHFGSSPTGVLQKATFVSLSNSSSGSSPTAESKKTGREGASLGDDVLGSTFASTSSIPSL